jgi:ribulose-5-phosphate 4-epimerase/fuculose-1-phosphate aldolase
MGRQRRGIAGNGDEENANNIYVQDPVEPTSFWVNPFGVAWPLLKASDLIRVNAEGKVVEGGPCRLLNAAGRISTSRILPTPGKD